MKQCYSSRLDFSLVGLRYISLAKALITYKAQLALVFGTSAIWSSVIFRTAHRAMLRCFLLKHVSCYFTVSGPK